MDEKSLSGSFSQFLPGAGGPPADPQTPSQPDNILVTSLKAAAGSSGAPLAQAVEAFLQGEGELYETTRAAVTRSGAASVSDLTSLLVKQFNLKGPIAELISALLVKLLPAITAKEKETKKKPRKAKPKTTTGKTQSSSRKKPKPKETSAAKKPRPKPASSAKKPKKPAKKSAE